MQTGTIKRLTDRGFGFISILGQEKELFFHSNELKGVTFEELKEGDKVQFEVGQSEKGPNAKDVSRASEGEAKTADETPVAEETESTTPAE